MASIDKRPNGEYRARWREYPNGPQKTKHFKRKLDADRFLVKVQHDLLSGTYVAPDATRTTLDAYYRLWLARMTPTWRRSTRIGVEGSFERHILPALGGRPLTSIQRSDVEAMASALKLAPATVATIGQHLGQLMRAAIDDGLLVRNPTYRARLPRKELMRAQPVPLEVARDIQAALPDWLAVAVPLGLGAGLRQGEASGLTVDRVQFLRKTVLVDRQLISRPEPVLAPPKTESSNRTVPLADIVLEPLSAHLARFPAAPSETILRKPGGGLVDSNAFGYAWREACKKAGAPGLRYHDLRHTFASTLLSRGVSVKAVSEWLGHASAVITLTTYAHLMPADEDVARAVLDAALVPAMTERAVGTA